MAERLKQEGKQEIFQNETMEELEDEEGNVYNKKTYEDLKKQGLIWPLFIPFIHYMLSYLLVL